MQAFGLTLAEAALTCGDYAQAESAYRLALADAEIQGNRQLQGQVWARLGVLFRRRERMEESAAYFTNALRFQRSPNVFPADTPASYCQPSR